MVWGEALLLHQPESISVNMAAWRGHYGTLMPFYVACERAGGFVGKSQRIRPAPQTLPGGWDGAAAENALSAAGAVGLHELGLYTPPRKRDGTVVDWGAPIRLDSSMPRVRSQLCVCSRQAAACAVSAR
jgi:hypothetical protein